MPLDCRMADNEQKENDLKAQIEKIADSIKEQGTFLDFSDFFYYFQPLKISQRETVTAP